MMNQPQLTRKEWNMLTQMLTRKKCGANDSRAALKDKILSQLNESRCVHDEITIDKG